jgi:hypothetical protein
MGNERQAVGRLETLGEYALSNVRTELLDVAARDENRLAGLYRSR